MQTQTDPNAAPARAPDRPLTATPAVERLLGRVRSELTRLILLHGLGSALLAAALWLAFCFVADYFLHVPHGVRMFHLAVALALPAFVVWRELVRPLRARPHRAGLAQLLERRDGSLGELIVSAVDLQESPTPSGDPERIREVLVQAESRAASLSPAGVLDARKPTLRLGAGLAAACAGAVAALLAPHYAAIFFDRLFGGTEAWPQRTQLALSIPLAGERAQIENLPGEIRVKLARGSDLPVLVRAEGAVPDEVVLHFGDGQEVELSGSGDGAFRTLLRGLQEDVVFHATGGDDLDGEPTVSVRVLEPPDVAALAVRIVPPAYTGAPERVERDRDVQVLAGSALAITILPRPKTAHGSVRVLPDDRTIELAPRAFPLAGAASDAAPEPGLGFDVVADASLRYRFELSDDTGLKNPDPGLFSVEVVEDRPPEVEVLSPGRSELETTRGGALRLVARAEDDFGVLSLTWQAQRTGVAGADAMRGDLAPPAEDLGAGGPDRRVVVGGKRLDARELLPAGEELADGDQISIDVAARDSRPEGTAGKGVGRAATLHLRIVSEDEFLRRVQDRLSRLRVQVGELEELARAKVARVHELVAGLESDAPGGASSAELATALSGARRVQGDADAITRELASIAEGVLYARLDEKAGALLEELDGELAKKRSRDFPAEAWAGIAQRFRESRSGSLPGLAGQLISILELSLTVSYQDAAHATQALERAGQAVDLADVHAALMQAGEQDTQMLTHLEDLLSRLAEWDNFQSILSLTRDILNRQKSLLDRTRSSTGK